MRATQATGGWQTHKTEIASWLAVRCIAWLGAGRKLCCSIGCIMLGGNLYDPKNTPPEKLLPRVVGRFTLFDLIRPHGLCSLKSDVCRVFVPPDIFNCVVNTNKRVGLSLLEIKSLPREILLLPFIS